MNTTTKSLGMLVRAMLFGALASTACAQGVEPARWMVLDPAPAARTAEVLADAPDGGLIQGTMIAKGRHYAVTATSMLTVGDAVGNCRVASVSLDRVVLSSGTQSFELEIRTGIWTARPVECTAE